jgi:3-methyladenine DNA glycosylase AlkD
VCGENLDDTMPDFLVHIPGYMTNLLVMEVKAPPRQGHRNDDLLKMAKDLRKLTAYRRDLVDEDEKPANYYAAYFWVYGIDPRTWPELCREMLEKVDDWDEVDLSLIRCYIHEAARTRAVRVRWHR